RRHRGDGVVEHDEVLLHALAVDDGLRAVYLHGNLFFDLITAEEGELEIKIEGGLGLGDDDVRSAPCDDELGEGGGVEELLFEGGQIAPGGLAHDGEEIVGGDVLELVLSEEVFDA